MTSPRGPRVPGQYLDMLACHRLLKKSVDAPEVNENIWFLPDLFTSQPGHMSWQVTLVQRRIGDRSGGLLLFFLHTGQAGHNPETQMNMFLAQETNSAVKLTKTDLHPGEIHSHFKAYRDLFLFSPCDCISLLFSVVFSFIKKKKKKNPCFFGDLTWLFPDRPHFSEIDLTSCHHLISTSAITRQSTSRSHGEV